MTLAETLQPVLERKIPAALIAAFLVQTAGALFWAGSAAERIATLERSDTRNQAAIEQVAVMQAQLADIKTVLARIENKLDRRPPN
ncbi:MAG: hypothetical protein WDN08_11160 [Rhizomicrobium sp.]